MSDENPNRAAEQPIADSRTAASEASETCIRRYAITPMQVPPGRTLGYVVGLAFRGTIVDLDLRPPGITILSMIIGPQRNPFYRWTADEVRAKAFAGASIGWENCQCQIQLRNDTKRFLEVRGDWIVEEEEEARRETIQGHKERLRRMLSSEGRAPRAPGSEPGPGPSAAEPAIDDAWVARAGETTCLDRAGPNACSLREGHPYDHQTWEDGQLRAVWPRAS